MPGKDVRHLLAVQAHDIGNDPPAGAAELTSGLLYRYVGPYGARPRRLHDGVEDLTGWDVLVVQKELGSDDRRKLWGSPVRVYAAPPGTPRPHPARLPEEQGWQELTRGAMLRRPRAPPSRPPSPAPAPR